MVETAAGRSAWQPGQAKEQMKYQPRSKWAPQYPGWNTGRSVAPLDRVTCPTTQDHSLGSHGLACEGSAVASAGRDEPPNGRMGRNYCSRARTAVAAQTLVPVPLATGAGRPGWPCPPPAAEPGRAPQRPPRWTRRAAGRFARSPGLRGPSPPGPRLLVRSLRFQPTSSPALRGPAAGVRRGSSATRRPRAARRGSVATTSSQRTVQPPRPATSSSTALQRSGTSGAHIYAHRSQPVTRKDPWFSTTSPGPLYGCSWHVENRLSVVCRRPMVAVMLDREQLRAFAQRGFVVVPQVIPAEGGSQMSAAQSGEVQVTISLPLLPRQLPPPRPCGGTSAAHVECHGPIWP